MQKVLVLVFADLTYDARVTRQINWLSASHEVTVLCFKGLPQSENVTYVEIEMQALPMLRKLRLAMALGLRLYNVAYNIQHSYFSKLGTLREQQFDFIVANDVETLPLAFKLQQQAKIIFDAHEYAPRHFEDKLWWKLLFGPWYTHLCKTLIPRVNAMTTVCDGLANEYEKHFGKRPHITTNATKYHDLPPTDVKKPVRLVHHGIINKSRKVEVMIDVMKHLGDGYVLDFILMLPEYASPSTVEYFESFKQEVSQLPNVNLLPSLPNEQIVPAINAYDIGIFLLEPVNFNYTNALPNKLFDFIQARLAIAIGPSPEMQKIVEKHQLGVVSPTFEAADLADSIKALSADDIMQAKRNAHKAARGLSEEENKRTFEKLIQ